MVDFKKRLKQKERITKTNPIEIYDSLDRRSEAGPLRPAQEEILQKWFNNHVQDRDLIIKLHTGQGKTLIGLLISQSFLNMNIAPSLYICPNIYLAEQTRQQADKFGIKHTDFDEFNSFPSDFLDGKAILITHIQKLFNGKSVFGIDGNFQEIGSIIVDDSHACIDSIRNSFSLRLKSDHAMYGEIFSLFEGELLSQGEGTLIEIKNRCFNSFLPVPYWSWEDKRTEVTEIIAKYREEQSIKFVWPLIKNDIHNCQCFISGNEIEILPYFNPIHKFGSFDKANHRILMSATTQNDSFFIKGLGLSTSAVLNPLTYSKSKWSGEKMIIIPSMINSELDRNYIGPNMAKPRPDNKAFGIAILTPSFKIAKFFEANGAMLATPDNIFDCVNRLKNGDYSKSIVFANRYDGIDLPDASCRILVIDSMPFAESLSERYEEDCRDDSDVIKIKLTQKIEQGLGRSVRGEKDYSVIILLNSDLIKFIRSSKSNMFFSKQTQKQIEIGFEIVKIAREDAVEDIENDRKIVNDLIRQCTQRDVNWKDFYIEKMDEIEDDNGSPDSNAIKLFELERIAEEAYYSKDAEKAVDTIQKLLDSNSFSESERGWYLQLLARYQYTLSKSNSNKTQLSAFRYNYQLLKPKEGVSYKKLDYLNENRIQRIKTWIGSEKNYEELMLKIHDILSNLNFGQESDRFERSMKDLGIVLGFLSQRPDKEFKKGPDNLWCGVSNSYIFFECKSEVLDDREEINKAEASQMNSHCAWFEEEYGKDVKVKRIWIIPTKQLSYHANLGYEVEVMRKAKLKSLRENVLNFFKEFKNYKLNDISDDKINTWIQVHKLDFDSICSNYSEEIYKK